MWKLNRDSQLLTDIMEQSRREKMVRLKLHNGEILEAIPDCFTYLSPNDDDEDVDAIRFLFQRGGEITLMGQDIEEFEVL